MCGLAAVAYKFHTRRSVGPSRLHLHCRLKAFHSSDRVATHAFDVNLTRRVHAAVTQDGLDRFVIDAETV